MGGAGVDVPRGWYPDPGERFVLRWWDGQEWSADASNSGEPAVQDPGFSPASALLSSAGPPTARTAGAFEPSSRVDLSILGDLQGLPVLARGVLGAAPVGTCITPLDVPAAQACLLECLSRNGNLAHPTDHGVEGTLASPGRVNPLLAGLLLLLYLAPGVVYLYRARQVAQRPFHVTLEPTSDGTRVAWFGSVDAIVVRECLAT